MHIKHQLVATGLFATFAFAGSSMAGESEHFTQLDADGDGTISYTEAAADPVLRESWTTADTNKDGKLERAEFSAFEIKPMDDAK